MHCAPCVWLRSTVLLLCHGSSRGLSPLRSSGASASAGAGAQNARAGHLVQLTFLRMGDLMFDNWDAFTQFLHRLHTP